MAEGYPLIEALDVDLEKPREECGVVGVFVPGEGGEEVAALTYQGLAELQHRGQDAAGICVGDELGLVGHKGLGLITQALPHGPATLVGIPKDAYVGVGQTRYGTSAASNAYEAAQPQRGEHNPDFVLGHNGHIGNMPWVAMRYDIDPGEGTDSQVLTKVIDVRTKELDDLDLALDEILPQLIGAYSLVISDVREGRRRLKAIRDPWGFRPLVMGQFLETEGGYMFASETPALRAAGATLVRPVQPGEIVTIDEGIATSSRIQREAQQSRCSLEWVYFSRPDGEFDGRNVNAARVAMGRQLALEAPVDADVIIGVPDSGIEAAQGFALQAGIGLEKGFYKSPYIGRTFIGATQEERERLVRAKLSPMSNVMDGRRVVLTDDSIIRGTTLRTVVGLVRAAGATEVHLRISSPKNQYPCFYGMNTGDPKQLLAHDRTLEQMRTYLDVDSLHFLSTEGLAGAIASPVGSLCMACMTGGYPTADAEREQLVSLGMPGLRKP